MEKNNYKNIFYFSIVLVYSIILNQYYGNLGLHSLDSTIGLSNGFRLTLGQVPFNDFWVTSGLLTDVIQSFFFKIFGNNWQSYVLHASIFNALLSVSVFLFLKYLNLSNFQSLIYSLSTATITYPLSGVLLVDFHSLIISSIGLILFFYAIKEGNKFILFILPFVFLLAFLCKQIPAGYFIVLIGIFSIIYSYKLKITWPLTYLVSGSLFAILIFLFFLNYFEITFFNFYTQYIEFALTIFSNSKDDSLIVQLKEISKIKYFILIFLIFIFYLITTQLRKNNYDFYKLGFISILSIVIFLTEIFTNNQNVTLGVMPLMIAMISTLFIKDSLYFTKIKYFMYFIILILSLRLLMENIYYLIFIPFMYLIFIKKKEIYKNFSSLFLILIIIFTTFNYEKFVKIRRFNDIFNNVSNFIPGKDINKKFSGLRWKTNIVNTEKEVGMIRFLLNYEEINDENLMIITNLQIFSFLLNKENFTPVKYWMKNKSYPSKNSPYRFEFESFFKKKIVSNKIDKILLINDTDLKIEEFKWISNCFRHLGNLDFEIKEYELRSECS